MTGEVEQSKARGPDKEMEVSRGATHLKISFIVG
jgi:hypothetical protein